MKSCASVIEPKRYGPKSVSITTEPSRNSTYPRPFNAPRVMTSRAGSLAARL
jgi:hypothetical protein